MNCDAFTFAGPAVVDLAPAGDPTPPSAAPARLAVGGIFTIRCYDWMGRLKWCERAPNGVTTNGLDHVLNVVFRGTTPITSWYIGLIDNAGFSAYALADTNASHSGWSEVASANVSNSTRPAWSPGSPSSSAIVNSTTANYNMTPSGSLTVRGLFLSSDSVLGSTDSTKLLFSTATFTGGTQAVSNGDVLKVTYTVSSSNNPSNS